MARKRSTTLSPETRSDEAISFWPEANGAPPAESEAAVAASTAPGSKKEAVQIALGAGVSMPKEVAKYVKDQFDIDMTPGHVSTIKAGLNRDSGRDPSKTKPRRTVRRNRLAPQQEPEASKKPTTLTRGAGLVAQDLVTLAGLVERAGGVDELQQVLSIFARMR